MLRNTLKPALCAAIARGVGAAGERECGGRERMWWERERAVGERERWERASAVRLLLTALAWLIY
jgi:hypothetical protein